MKISFSLARALQVLLQGESLPASQLKHPVVKQMVEDGVLQRRSQGAGKAVMAVVDPAALLLYLRNHFSIADLDAYVLLATDDAMSRADAVLASGNSKLRQVRTFRGFPVQTLSPVAATMNGQPVLVAPIGGTCWFIEQFEGFRPAPDVTIVGIENGENFQRIREYGNLFREYNPLFVCRYPQSGDLIQWLKAIPNKYLHFGDLDFEGIGIYLQEYHRHLDTRASFFIPMETGRLLQLYGNRELYERQRESIKNSLLDAELERLTTLFHKYGKVLEQEVFIKNR